MKNMFAMLALVAAMVMNVGVAKAADIFVEDDDATNLTINFTAALEENYKVIISHADLVAIGAADGLVDLTPVKPLSPSKSLAAAACRDSDDAAYSYAGVIACAVSGTNSSDGKASFDIDLAYKVELAGPGSIDLAVSLDGPGAGASAFDASAADIDGNGSVLGLLDQDDGIVHWEGAMLFNEGPLFDETVVVDVTKNP